MPETHETAVNEKIDLLENQFSELQKANQKLKDIVLELSQKHEKYILTGSIRTPHKQQPLNPPHLVSLMETTPKARPFSTCVSCNMASTRKI